MGFPAPNNSTFRGNNTGSSCQPSNGAGATGRGSQPSGDRFNVGALMSRAQNPEVIAPGKGVVPTEPFGQSGQPKPAMMTPADFRPGK
jgi:hypothetical protein